MLHPAMQNNSIARSSGQQAAMQVSLVIEQNSPAPQVPAQPLETPQDIKPVDNVPTPMPSSKSATKPTPSKATSKAAASNTSVATASDKPANDSQELEDVIGLIRDNWLEPPGNASFRCRLRIDYAVGGKIMAVNFIKGCGALALDDSVRRAIWKTQSLPLRSAKHEAGSIEIDFTP